MSNIRITDTAIGREFGWDYLADVRLDDLESARAAKMRVIQKPYLFPNANMAACEALVREIDAFMLEYGELLMEFV